MKYLSVNIFILIDKYINKHTNKYNVINQHLFFIFRTFDSAPTQYD